MNKTPGQAAVEALTRQLGPDMEWTESEQVTLSAIEAATNRLTEFRERFDAAAADPKASPSALATLSGEGRLLEGAIQKWAASLDPHNETVKSLRHQHAANMRWHRASGT
jgi:hypothetical protein